MKIPWIETNVLDQTWEIALDDDEATVGCLVVVDFSQERDSVIMQDTILLDEAVNRFQKRYAVGKPIFLPLKVLGNINQVQIDLGQFPVQTCWPGDVGPLITWPLVVTKGPGDDKRDVFNLGIYRMQVTGRDTTVMRWLKQRGVAAHFDRWKNKKREPLQRAKNHDATDLPHCSNNDRLARSADRSIATRSDLLRQALQMPAGSIDAQY